MAHWVWGLIVVLALGVPLLLNHVDKEADARAKFKELAAQERKLDNTEAYGACITNAITAGDKQALNNCYATYDVFMKHREKENATE